MKGGTSIGGMPEDFDKAHHGLRKIRVETHHDLIFGSFSDEAPCLEDYLSPTITGYLDRFFCKPIKLIGRTRQRVSANWKLYIENTRDPYHAMMLHPFMATFGAFLPIAIGGVKLSAGGQHSCLWTKPAKPSDMAHVGTHDADANQ